MTLRRFRRPLRRVLPLAAFAFLACRHAGGERGTAANLGGAPPTDSVCAVVQAKLPLADDLVESSGVAASRRTPGVWWTHDDSGWAAEVAAIDSAGSEIGRVKVRGARNRDWEDVAVGPCGAGSCVYAGDIGDNAGQRSEIVVWRFPEPLPGDRQSARAARLAARYPTARHNAEALFALPDGSLYIVTKGTSGLPIELYRWPMPPAPGRTVTLERVRGLAPAPNGYPDQVTGAGASPNGRWVAVRTYSAIFFYRTADLLGSGTPAYTMDVRPLGEPQGEAVALADDGSVVLTTEARAGQRASVTRLKCALR
jgi:hypothetical protein